MTSVAPLTKLQRQRQYRLLNKARIQQCLQEYYRTNREAIVARQRQYRTRHHHRLKDYYERNREAIQEKQREYRAAHREARRDYYMAHRGAIQEKQKEYRLENRAALVAAQRSYRTAHREAINKRRREYYQAHKDQSRSYYLKNRKPKSSHTWTCPSQVHLFFETAKEQLLVGAREDWYRISWKQIRKIGGFGLYSVFGGLGKALEFAYPDVRWEMEKFSFRGKKSSQRWLRVVLEKVLPEKTVVLEDYLHPDLLWDEERNYKMQLDVWVPQYQLGLEYQGEHHYEDFCFAYGSGSLSLFMDRDEKKRKACAQKEITLITIPYWWDGKKESLASTLFQVRPDVFTKTHFPHIPISPPSPTTTKRGHILKDNNKVASLLMHAQVWNKEDPTGWLISEKLDGFRAIWNGSKLFSRNGSTLPVPPDFTASFPPDVCLDGELWSGYDTFNKLQTIIQRSDTQQDSQEVLPLWSHVKFCVFDAPMHPGNYAERHAFASHFSSSNLCVIPFVTCLGQDHLQTMLHQITSKKGEGIMLYHPSSKYVSGRTNLVLKVKSYEEEDVKFIKVNPNSYSFLCEQKNGVECTVKCSGWDYSFPPSPGTTLTVKFNGYSQSQKMKFPFLLRVRNNSIEKAL